MKRPRTAQEIELVKNAYAAGYTDRHEEDSDGPLDLVDIEQAWSAYMSVMKFEIQPSQPRYGTTL